MKYMLWLYKAKGLSNEDKIRVFSVFGGVPYYNSLIDDKLSVRENLINLLVIHCQLGLQFALS